MFIEPYPYGAGFAPISGLETLNHERGITRGGQDFAAFPDSGHKINTSRWPEPFRRGWTIGWELARAKAKPQITERPKRTDYDVGIERGKADYAARIDPIASRADWSPEFQRGWQIGWEQAKAAARAAMP